MTVGVGRGLWRFLCSVSEDRQGNGVELLPIQFLDTPKHVTSNLKSELAQSKVVPFVLQSPSDPVIHRENQQTDLALILCQTSM